MIRLFNVIIKSYPSEKKKSMYSTAPADWTRQIWAGNVAYSFVEWKLYLSIRVFSTDHYMISTTVDTKLWILRLEDICFLQNVTV